MNLWKVSTLAFAALFAATLATGDVPDAGAAKQPVMRDALDSLEQAHDQLSRATADKGGHRVKAMGLTKSAIDEVKAGIAYDNKN
jgi:hypothetical protein